MSKQHADYLSKHPERLADVAYNLAERRERLKYRAFSVITEGTEQLDDPVAVTSQGIEQAAFVFTGQGAQWYLTLFSEVGHKVLTIVQGKNGPTIDG